MFGYFYNTDPPKQQRIINAAMTEFSRHGYTNASTNTIVQVANISKGALFRYFKNKQILFQFLCDYAFESVMNEFYNKIDLSDDDIFTRLNQIMSVKIELLAQYPDMIDFLKVAMTEETPEIREYVHPHMDEIKTTSYAKIYDGIDYTKFKSDIDVTQALQIMTWTFDGLSNEVLAELKYTNNSGLDNEAFFAKAESYTQLLRSLFYN